MPNSFIEENLKFKFDDDYHVIHYDKHPDYHKIRRLNESKDVDFTAIHLFRTLFLIEVKDFRGHRIENRDRVTGGALAIEVAQKVRDTIAGVVAAHHRGNAETWERFTRCLTSPEPPVRVLLWLEDDLPPGPRGRRQNQASVMIDLLKTQLRWLTTQIMVANLAAGAPIGIHVTNLPGAGRST